MSTDTNIFNRILQSIRESEVKAVEAYCSDRSDDWYRENILTIAYPEEIYNFIKAGTTAIQLSSTVTIYNVFGKWVQIVKQAKE